MTALSAWRKLDEAEFMPLLSDVRRFGAHLFFYDMYGRRIRVRRLDSMRVMT